MKTGVFITSFIMSILAPVFLLSDINATIEFHSTRGGLGLAGVALAYFALFSYIAMALVLTVYTITFFKIRKRGRKTEQKLGGKASLAKGSAKNKVVFVIAAVPALLYLRVVMSGLPPSYESLYWYPYELCAGILGLLGVLTYLIVFYLIWIKEVPKADEPAL